MVPGPPLRDSRLRRYRGVRDVQDHPGASAEPRTGQFDQRFDRVDRDGVQRPAAPDRPSTARSELRAEGSAGDRAVRRRNVTVRDAVPHRDERGRQRQRVRRRLPGLVRPAHAWAPPSDSTYIHNTINQLIGTQNVDPHRVYVTGFSAGGYEAWRMGCLYSSQVAGIAIVGNNMNQQLYDTCHLTRPESEYLLVGGADSIRPSGIPGKLPGAPKTTARWRQLDGCTNLSTGVRTARQHHPAGLGSVRRRQRRGIDLRRGWPAQLARWPDDQHGVRPVLQALQRLPGDLGVPLPPLPVALDRRGLAADART